MDDVRPSQWMVLAGGALLFFFSFLDLFDVMGESGNSWKQFGIFTWPALLGLLCAGVTAAVVFGKVSLPSDILTFSVNQLLVIAAFTAVLIEVGMVLLSLFSDFYDPAIGLWLSTLAAITLLAGTVMEQEGGATITRSASAPPSPF
jgi:hypothetical protein